jgi:hypothetical protein
MISGLWVQVWIFNRKEFVRKRDSMLYSVHNIQGKSDDLRFMQFVRVTDVLFRHCEVVMFFDSLMTQQITQMERSNSDHECIKYTLSAMALLQDIKQQTRWIYTHGVRASHKKDTNELVTYGQQCWVYSGTAYYPHEIKRKSADVCHAEDEGETSVKDLAALDNILRKAESKKHRIRSIPYEKLHKYGVNLVYPHFRQRQIMRDYDGNRYWTIQMGNQCCMAENLRVRHFQEGDPIPYARHGEAVAELKQQPVCCDYMFNRRHASAYRLYYNKQEIRDQRGWSPKDTMTRRVHFARYRSAPVLDPEIYCAGELREEKPGMNLTGFVSGQTGYYYPGGLNNSKWSYGHVTSDNSQGIALYRVKHAEVVLSYDACCSVRLVRDV